MPALVTGASGFLGGRLVQLLAGMGEEVSVLARPASDLRHLDGVPYRVVRGALSDRAALDEAVRGATHIFHCAACSTDWAPPRTYSEANVLGVEALLTAARGSAILRRFVHVSTTDIYGYPETPCTEQHRFVDAGLPYNRSKGAGEAAVWAAHAEGLPVTVVRPATIYGPRGKDFTEEIATLLRQRLMAYVDGGEAPGGFAYVDNVAHAMITAADSSATVGEAYNIADGTHASWREYATMFARQLGVRPPWIDLSFGTAMTAAGVFEASHRSLGLRGRPLLTRHAVYLLGRNQEFPIEKARRDFAFTPRVSLEEGIARSVAWLVQTGKFRP